METSDLGRQIESRIQEYLLSGDERFAWTFEAVRRFTFLPLYLGWTAVLGIRSDGSLVRWNHEDDRDAINRLEDPFLRRLALAQGVKKYPELSALVPEKPPAGVTCSVCRGAGQVPGVLANMICQCGGLGWLIPDEKRDDGIG